MSMTSLERMTRALDHQPVDLTPVAVSPWGATIERWTEEGHLKAMDIIEESIAEVEGEKGYG